MRGRGPGDAAALLVRLGPAYVKVAQLLSARRDQLPVTWCDRLALLTDAVPAPPAQSITAVLERAYGRELPFARLDLEPIAGGSIATVHKGLLADGRAVAVKVRRLGVEESLTLDLTAFAFFARTLRKLPGLRRVPLDEIAGQVGAAVRGQADLVRERDSLSLLHANFAGYAHIRVPGPVDELCTDDVVVMELMTGLRRLRPDEIAPGQRREVVQRLLTAVYQMLFVDGFVHCDLHHGNVYADPQGSLVLLDAGFVVVLPERVRMLFADFFMCMATGRGLRCAEIVLESAARIDPRCDRQGFTDQIDELVRDASRSTAGGFSLVEFAGRLFDLQRRYHIYAAAEFVFPLLALLVIEGMVNELDSEVDFQAAAIPVLAAALPPRPRSRSHATTISSSR
jgi:ubiquinone biosynthesis protein